jgi:hypothetical protein
MAPRIHDRWIRYSSRRLLAAFSGHSYPSCSFISVSNVSLLEGSNFCGAISSNHGIYTRSTGGYGGAMSGVGPKLKKVIRSGSLVVVV